MGKKKAERRLNESSAMAMARSVRVSPQKLNLVVRTIRGLSASRARNHLSLSRKRISKEVVKVLDSAIANAENNHSLDVDRLIVSEAFVGKSITMKRFRPRARGRVGKIIKPFSRLTIIVSEQQESV
tara:strand:+ start:586 stop:966 length:381 start_codon:yes stop_codon:yes gene_type:complete